MRTSFWALLAAAALLAHSSRALAQESSRGRASAAGSTDPSDERKLGPRPISVGLLLGYGHDLGEPANPWSIGFGARGGYNLDALFLGARFVFYLGKTESVENDALGRPAEASVNIWELGIEAGYDLRLGPLAVRPGAGFGLASVNA